MSDQQGFEAERPSVRNKKQWLRSLQLWFSGGFVALALLFLLLGKGGSFTHPKFLRSFSYREHGWVPLQNSSESGDIEIFWVDETEEKTEKAMDLHFKGRTNWIDTGFLPGYVYTPPGTTMTDAKMGVLLLPGHHAKIDLGESDASKANASKGCTVFAVYTNKATTWERLKLWLFGGW